METVYFKGNPCHTCGNIPKVGDKASCYNLVTPELKEINCHDLKGRRVVMNIFRVSTRRCVPLRCAGSM